jgi:hypothetical protein
VHLGASDRSHDVVADPYVVSRSDSREDRYFMRVLGSAGSAVQLDGADKADFFVRSQVDTTASPGEFRFPSHGAASSSAFYDFSVDTESSLSFAFSAFASATASANADVVLNLFDIDTQTYLRQGTLAGQGTFYVSVPRGNYGVTLTTFSEAGLPADILVDSESIGDAIVNLSLQVTALLPPPPVPEPSIAVLLLLGIGALGTARRGRLSSKGCADRLAQSSAALGMAPGVHHSDSTIAARSGLADAGL